MACDVQQLLADAECFLCASPGDWELIELALLCRLSEGIILSCDVQELIAEAKCFNVPPGQRQLLKLALLCRIMTNGGSGGGSVVLSPASQSAVPANGTLDTDGNNLFFTENGVRETLDRRIASTVAIATVNSWQTRVTTNANWSQAAWSPELGLFVCVGFTALTTNQVMTSQDGITWTVGTSAADRSWRSVAWSPALGLFAAVANTGAGSRIMTSPDGLAWTARANPEDNNWLGICWSPELALFVATASTGTNQVMTSPDGITWTARAAPTGLWYGVCWSKELGLFASAGFGGNTACVMTSPDGITWTAHTTLNRTWRGICWSSERGLFAAVCESGVGTRVMTSPDGLTWTEQITPADNNWTSVVWTWELGMFVAVAESGGTDRVMTSPDGITWTLRTSTADNNSWIVWSPELMMFVTIGGTAANRVRTANLPGFERIVQPQVYQGIPDPPTITPDFLKAPALYYVSTTGVQYVWQISSQTWI